MRKPFCLAPWIHSFRGPNGERRLCCHAQATGTDSFKDFDSYWNSSYLKDVRQQMLAGTPPSHECRACLHKSTSLAPPYIFFEFERDNEEKILRNTEEDGTYNLDPIYLDYRVRNTCNLSCRTCNGLFSSQIDLKNKAIESGHESFDHFDADHAQEEWRRLAARSDIKRCYFAGGEAFLQKEHFEDLERIQNKEEVVLTYNTNLAFSLEAIKKKESLLSQFKEIRLAVSIDGTEGTGEFIRSGLNWHQFQRNIEEVKSLPYLKIGQFDITLTLPTLLNLEGLAQFLHHHMLPYLVTRITPGGYASLISPEILEQKDFEELIQRKMEFLQKKDPAYFGPFIEFLKNYKEAPKNGPSPKELEEELEETLKYTKALDQAFSREGLIDYYQDFPPALKILKGIEQSLEQKLVKHLSPELIFWEKLLDQNGYKKENYDYIIHQDIPDSLKRASVLVSSYPSFLSLFLSKEKREANKFNNYHALKNRKGLKLLGPFSYLLRERKSLRGLAIFLDHLTKPIRPLIAFHFMTTLPKS